MKKIAGIITALIFLTGWIWVSQNRVLNVLNTSGELYSPNTGTTPVIIFVALGVIAIAVFIFIRRRK